MPQETRTGTIAWVNAETPASNGGMYIAFGFDPRTYVIFAWKGKTSGYDLIKKGARVTVEGSPLKDSTKFRAARITVNGETLVADEETVQEVIEQGSLF